MTLLWFVIWLLANNIGSPEPIVIGDTSPVNAWAGTLLFAAAVDLAKKAVYWYN